MNTPDFVTKATVILQEHGEQPLFTLKVSDYATLAKALTFLANQTTATAIEQKPDRMGLAGFCEMTGKGKSWVYKKIKDIPHKKFGRDLIFSRKETEFWMNEQLLSGDATSEKAEKQLAKSAKSKH